MISMCIRVMLMTDLIPRRHQLTSSIAMGMKWRHLQT